MSWSKWIAIAAGGGVMLLGASVLIGWHTHSLPLMQLGTAHWPMHRNAALGFVLCGAGQLLLVLHRARAARGAAALLILLAAASLTEHVFGVDLHIDRALVGVLPDASADWPARMSMATAICFVLVGTALILQTLPRAANGVLFMTAILDAAVFATGMTALFAHAVGVVWRYPFESLSRMAFHSALGFFGVGIARVAMRWGEKRRGELTRLKWLPLLAGLVVAMSTLLLWKALTDENASQIRQETAHAAESLKLRMVSELETRFDSLVRMARRWEMRHGTPREEWEDDAARYVEHFQGFQAVQWVDPSFHVRWMVPLAGNEPALNLDVGFEPNRRAAAQAARDRREVRVSRVIDLVQGGKGFLAQVPIFDDGRFGGFIVGVFQVPEIFEAIREHSGTARYFITIFDGPHEVYRSKGTPSTPGVYAQEVDADIHGVHWRLTLQPMPDLVAQDTSALPEAALLAGLMLAVLLSVSIYSIQVAGIRARALAAGNRNLKNEVAARAQIEATLRETNAFLDSVVENIPAMFWVKDAETLTYLRFNRAGAALMGVPRDELIGKKDADLFPEDAAAYVQKDREAIAALTLVDVAEEPLHTRDKGTRYVHMKKVPVCDERGAPRYLLGIGEDITEHKRVHEALQSSEERLRLITDNIPALISYLDRGERFRFANRAYQDWLGIAPSNLVGMSLRELYGDAMYEQIRPRIEAALAGETVIYEREMMALSGRRHIEVTAIPHRDERGLVRGLFVLISDITARKQTEAVLRESEERFQGAFRYAAIGVALVAPDGRWVRVNEALCGILGYSETELMALTFQDITHPDDLEADLVFVRQVLAGEIQTYQMEKRYFHKDGHIVWVLLSVSLLRDAQGAPLNFISQIQDISPRKLAELALERNQRFVEAILNSIPEPIFVKDSQHRWVALNDRFCESMLQPREKLIMHTDGEFLPADVAAANYDEDDHVLLTGKPLIAEVELPFPAGSQWLLKRKSKVYSPEGEPLVVGIATDISILRGTQEALRKSEVQLRAINEASPVGIFVTDADGSCTYTNPAYQRIAGMPLEQTLGNGWSLAIHPEDRERVFLDWQSAAQRNVAFESTHRFLRADGTTVWAEVRAAELRIAETLLGYVGVVEDITARRSAEERMKASLLEKEALLKEIHHRVKNNMQVVSSLLQLQSRYIHDPESREVFRESRARIQSMALVHEKLYGTHDLARVDFGDYARSLANMLAGTFADGSGRIAVKVRSERVMLDVDRAVPAGLILNELISNCYKHAFAPGASGTIDIELFRSESGQVTMIVRDSGRGLPATVKIENSPSLGLRLVNILAQQIGATLAWRNAGGAECRLTFAGSNEAAEVSEPIRETQAHV